VKRFVGYSYCRQINKSYLKFNAYFSNIIFAQVKNVFPHLKTLFKSILLAYFLFTASRLLFLFFNYNSFNNQPISNIIKSVIGGIWFDTTAIAYFFGWVILLQSIPTNYRNSKQYQLIVKVLFMISAALTLLLNFIDIGYFPITGKRSGFELIKMQSTQNASVFIYMKGYWHLLLLLIGMLVLTWKLYPRHQTILMLKGFKQYAVALLLFPLVLVITFIGARGSVGLKPLNTLDAAKISGADLMPLVLNTPFQMLLTLQQVGVEELHYLNEKEITNYFNTHKTVTNNIQGSKRNVVLIIVESLGKEYVGFYHQQKRFTPFLDSLSNYSTIYTNMFANSKRSIEGIPAIVAGMPSWMESDYINSFYQTNKLRSIGYYLTAQGYDCSFYHGGKNGTMSFDRFVQATEAGKYFGLNEYPDKTKNFDGNWGIFDEPYLKYVVKEFNTKPTPFFSTVFTLSSHHPYQLPPQYQNKFKGGELPIHATIEYVDFALQLFFNEAKKQPWYNQTLFVITADHSSENITPNYQTMAGRYALPLLVFDPLKPIQQIVPETMDQIGITDLILQQTMPKNRPYFSLYNHNSIQFEGGIYQLIKYPYVLHFDKEKSVGLYDLARDSLMQNNLINQAAYQPKIDSLTQQIKATLQTYHFNLIHNKMYLP
jgi:phosphoglycerol transferase MdoB-like AlkP superfamily enzyme